MTEQIVKMTEFRKVVGVRGSVGPASARSERGLDRGHGVNVGARVNTGHGRAWRLVERAPWLGW
jgi:hypothetical protein